MRRCFRALHHSCARRTAKNVGAALPGLGQPERQRAPKTSIRERVIAGRETLCKRFIMVREKKIIKNRIRGASGDSRRKEPSSLRLTPLDAPSSERTASSRIFVILGHGRPAASATWPARRIIISHLVTDQRTRSFAASAATNQCEPAVSGWFSPRSPRRRFSPAR